jgi:hypothetical protein
VTSSIRSLDVSTRVYCARESPFLCVLDRLDRLDRRKTVSPRLALRPALRRNTSTYQSAPASSTLPYCLRSTSHSSDFSSYSYYCLLLPLRTISHCALAAWQPLSFKSLRLSTALELSFLPFACSGLEFSLTYYYCSS